MGMTDYSKCSVRELEQDIENARKRIKQDEEYIEVLTKIKAEKEAGEQRQEGAAA